VDRGRAAIVAAILSLAVYGIPLVGPHAVWLLGETLLTDTRRLEVEPE
jgi:hypothetical protein